MSEQPSAPQALSERIIQTIASRYGMSEVHGSDGGPYMTLQSQVPVAQGQVGNVRVFRGGPLFQLVTNALQVPAIGLDAHMLFAFMPSDSPVPHFTLDSVCAGPHMAFHLDLIPRVDIGSHIAYMREVFAPLTPAWQAGNAVEGLSAAQLQPMQYAIMSPWMLANRATPEAFANIDTAVDQYLAHWFTLVDNGVSAAALDGISAADLISRDQRNKAAIFDPEIDKVWDQITPMIGPDASLALRTLLKQTST